MPSMIAPPFRVLEREHAGVERGDAEE